MKLFLTGTTGFIGSRLAQRLAKEGHQVSVLVRQDSDLAVLGDARPEIGIHIYDGTLRSMLSALEAAGPDLVIHVASLFLAQHQPDDVERLISSNIDMPTKLLEAMALTGVSRIINTGTSWQHFENAPFNPVNLYASTKQAFDDILTYYVQAKGFKALTLKLFDTYGPGDTRPKLFTLLRRTALSESVLKMSPGEQLLDIVFIDDVLDAYLAAIAVVDSAEQSCYAVSHTERHTLREVVRVYSEVTGHSLNIEWGGLDYRPRETLVPMTRCARLEAWHPKVSLTEGIRRMEGIDQIPPIELTI